MARRSARLQKQRSPTPSDLSNVSWETAQSESSPQPDRLPSVVEGEEPTMKTPQKTVGATPVKTQTSSQLPQPSNAATPLKNKSSRTLLTAITARTPTNRIKATSEEMHPAQHHASTAKVLDEARWLGFQALSHTAPPKQSSTLAVGSTTPSRTPISSSTKPIELVSSPDFKFRFRSPIPGLSPKSSRILGQGRDTTSSTATPGRAIFKADEFSTPADVSPRKMAVPKGKSNRYSDVHMQQFKKMDSIANHPSAFRADPNRFKSINSVLKRSPSKAELDKPEPTATKGPNKLKRTQSKMDLAEPSAPQPVSKLVATPLKRVQSKPDVTPTSSKLPRSHSTVRLVPPTRDGPVTQDGNPTAKRVKRTELDDATSTRPVSRDGSSHIPSVSGGVRPTPSKSALPRSITSRLMTPTKASLLRSQSVKTMKVTSMISSPSSAIARTPSMKNLFSPTNISQTMKDGIRKTSNSLQRVRSILCTPARKFSEDPSKIAAGTHLTPPAGMDVLRALPAVPKTAPIQKHVNFSTSTLERAANDELGKSPSPMKLRAGSEMPAGAVLYPKLQSGVDYPALPHGEDMAVDSPSRRLTFGGATLNTPAEFSFQSGKPINFGAPATGTIRVVRKSDAASLVEKKRKLDTFEEAQSSDKENSKPAEDEGRQTKRLKASPIKPPPTPSALSKLPRRLPKRTGSISQSRLAFLSTPKRAK